MLKGYEVVDEIYEEVIADCCIPNASVATITDELSDDDFDDDDADFLDRDDIFDDDEDEEWDDDDFYWDDDEDEEWEHFYSQGRRSGIVPEADPWHCNPN